jgi:hypothetical protein
MVGGMVFSNRTIIFVQHGCQKKKKKKKSLPLVGAANDWLGLIR